MSKGRGAKRDNPDRPGGTNDHFIPQFILRGFAEARPGSPSNRDIIRVDLDTGRIERRAVRSTASAKGLYDAPRMDKAGTRLEETYSRAESRASPAIKRLTAGDLNLSPGEREAVASFVAHQASRTVTYRRMVDGLFQAGLPQIEQYVLDLARQISPLTEECMAHYIAASRISPGDGDFLAGGSLTMAAGATPILVAMDWTLVQAPTGSAFILGDQPVLGIREVLIPADAREAVGCADQMPLSPTRLLWMQRAAGSGAGGSLAIRTATAKEVEAHNRFSLANSERYVFASTWELAEWSRDHRYDEHRIVLPDGSTVKPPRRPRPQAA